MIVGAHVHVSTYESIKSGAANVFLDILSAIRTNYRRAPAGAFLMWPE